MVAVTPALMQVPLACPLDGLVLRAENSGFRCEQGHHYDLSRHGYINLLPVQLKPSRDPGDSRAMVAARRAVLDAGIFDPLANALVALVCEHARAYSGTDALVVDAGCGDGYYTQRMALALRDAGVACAVLGVDISKWAVTAAARRHASQAWAVGNNKCLPVVQGCATLICSLFGFETWGPWAQLQKAGQRVITVDAGPRHLRELRERIYETVQYHDAPDDGLAEAAGYRPIQRHAVNAVRGLDNEMIAAQLLTMTPHRHRIEAGARESLELASLSSITLDAVIRVYERTRV